MSRKINFGEIWLADLNPTYGTEPGKTRPVLVIQNQALLDVFHPSTLVIPLTTNIIDDAEPLRIRIKSDYYLERDSDLLIDQLRAIDNKRLVKGPLLKLDHSTIRRIHLAILEILNYEAEKIDLEEYVVAGG